MAVASSSGRLTKSQWEGAVWGFLFPVHNALYSIAFGTYTETAEPIDMPFGLTCVVGPTNSVLRGADDPRRGRGNFGEITCPTSLSPLIVIATLAAKG